MEHMVVIADDLTGASDTGVQFGKYGLPTTVIVDGQNLGQQARPGEVWSVNTDSRPLVPTAAYRQVFGVAEKLRELGFVHIYKKLDSTLRGNPGEELDAVMDAFAADLALVAPSFPANRRMVVDGGLVMHPIQKTVRDVPELFRAGMQRQVGSIGLATVRGGAQSLLTEIAARREAGQQVLVLDATTEEDLAAIAGAAVQLPRGTVLAGSGGLAAHLPPAWGLSPSCPEVVRTPGVTLVVAGSRNRVTASQVGELLKVTTAPLVEVPAAAVIQGRAEEEMDRATATAARLLAVSPVPRLLVLTLDTLFTTREELPPETSSAHGIAIAGTLGEIARRLVTGGQVHNIVATGGDTAVHLCRILGAWGIRLVAELLPGIPMGRLMGGVADGMPVVTKAGGFGSPTAFVDIVQTFNNP